MLSKRVVPFRLDAPARRARLEAFNQRQEIRWFGFEGSLRDEGLAVVQVRHVHDGLLGGAGSVALNGGVISAGFDAACVLAASAHFEADVVVTLDLATRFLDPAF